MSAALVAALAGPAALAVVTGRASSRSGRCRRWRCWRSGRRRCSDFTSGIWTSSRAGLRRPSARRSRRATGAGASRSRSCTGAPARGWRTSATSPRRSSGSRAPRRRSPTAWSSSTATIRIRWSNPSAQALLGLDPSATSARRSPISPGSRSSSATSTAGDYSDAVTITSQRDAPLTLSLQIVPFGAEEKLLIARDITRLDAVARMRRDFIANVSHELKTPLTVVAGFLETMQDLELEPRQRDRYLALMAEQARSMQRLVDDLLTLSALESEQNAPVESGFGVGPAAARAVRRCPGRCPAGATGSALGDIDAATLARSSRDELASAFGNLVSATRSATRRKAARSRWHGGWRLMAPGVFAVHRQRHRHRARAPAAADRALLPRRPEPLARDRRHRPRARDRQARAAAPPGGTRRRQRAGSGQHVLGAGAGAEGASRGAPAVGANGAAPAGAVATGRESVPAGTAAAPPVAAGNPAIRS